MKCAVLATVLIFILPTQIGCCSHNTDDIIHLMAKDPNYRHDPCYIQWAKTKGKFIESENLERMAEHNRRIKEDSRNQKLKSIRSDDRDNYLKSTFWKHLVIIAGVIGGMFCCIAFFAYVTNATSDNQTNLNPDVSTFASPVAILPNNRTTPNVLLTNDTNLTVSEEGRRLPSSSLQAETRVPLLPRVINRQESLPSYDVAVRMASAHPKE